MTDYQPDILETHGDAGLATRSSRTFHNSSYESAGGASESSLARRYGKSRIPQGVNYEFTRDKGLLAQYFQMRESMFISVWGLKHFYGGEDAYDSVSDILVARQGNLCVAGIRCTVSTPTRPLKMPLEGPGFKLADLFPELDLKNKVYAEFSRYAVLPDFQGPEMSFEGSRRLFIKAASKGAEYGFAVCPLGQARNYRRIAAVLNLECTVRKDIEVPDRDNYEGIKMYIDMFDLRPLAKTLAESKTSRQSEEA